MISTSVFLFAPRTGHADISEMLAHAQIKYIYMQKKYGITYMYIQVAEKAEEP